MKAVMTALAALMIAASGLALIGGGVYRPLRLVAGRLFAVGLVLAASAALVPFR